MIAPMLYTIVYAKRAEARFLSHLEVARAFERALRRAGLPLALSRGFNPHPYLSFALPLGVGVASRSEYLEVELAQPVSPDLLLRRLQAEMPPGLRIKQAKPSRQATPALATLVGAAAYAARPTWRPVPDRTSLEGAVEALLARAEIKLGEEGKERDIRSGIWQLRPRVRRGQIALLMLLAAGSRQHVRPEAVLQALARLGGWEEERAPLICRLGLFACLEGRLIPLGRMDAPTCRRAVATGETRSRMGSAGGGRGPRLGR
ncbi:MAG: DUF2344 domain-containing protein [Clostridia bacterium]|nr:DUF2344 domain-containing protein [Clostridia bacterium]